MIAGGAGACDASSGASGAADAGPSDAADDAVPADASIDADAGTPDAAPPIVAARSYDVVLPTSADAPLRARLDLVPSVDGGAPAAVFTPLFGVPAVRSATLKDGALQIEGDVPGDDTTGTLHGLVVPLDASGNAVGTLHGQTGTTPFTATLAPDTTPPGARLDAIDDLVEASTPLPWDTFVVTTSEPVVPSSVMLSATNLIQGDTPLPMEWTPTAAGPTGTSRYEGRILDWGKFSISVHASLAPGAADPTGNTSVAFDAIAQVKSADAAPAQETFDEESVTFPDYAHWGDTTQLGGKAGADPACETVGCVSIGPSSCGGALSGIAGKLTPAGSPTQLVLRVRERSATADPSPIAIVVRTARPGIAPLTTTLKPLPLVDTSLGTLPWASAWTTVTVPLPAPRPGAPTTIGYVVALAPGTCSGVTRQLLVDLVSAN
jgi:hypothetical protein